MAEFVEVLNGQTNTNTVTFSDFFSGGTFVYLVCPTLLEGEGIEMETFLQIYLPNTGEQARMIRLENLNILDTAVVTPIPNQFRESGALMRLAFYASEAIQLQAYVCKPRCCGEDKLDDITNRLTRIETELVLIGATKLAEVVINSAVGAITNAVVGEVANILLPSGDRRGFTLFNPLPEPIYVDYADTVSVDNFMVRLDAVNPFYRESNYSGVVSGVTQSGNVNLQVRELL